MFKNKKLIIFDMDGTLIDSIGIWNKTDITLIHELGCLDKLDESFVQQQRDSKIMDFSKSKNPYPYLDYCGFLGKKYNSTLTDKDILNKRYEIAQDYLINFIKYKDNVPELLKILKDNNFKLIIASTTRKNNMDIYRNKNNNLINAANIDDYFEKVYTREDAKEIKPNPEIYFKILNEFNVTTDDCLIIEDSLIGVTAANNAGIDVIAIYDRYSDLEKEEIKNNSKYYFNNFKEMIDYLKRELN